MRGDSISSQLVDLTNFPVSEGVAFDPESVTLRGLYKDEISAHRAKRLWIETLESNFLLELDYDFELSVISVLDHDLFYLSCSFSTACARYAFWRITNNQAPEAQYIIETAHIPMCESRHEDILRAPDMRCIYESPFIYKGIYPFSPRRPRFGNLINRVFKRVFKTF